MPIKKVGKALRSVASGYKDYSTRVAEIQREAEKMAGKSGSREADVFEQAKIARRLKKERGVSFINSVKNSYSKK